jgi:hypothetical protein
MLASSCIGPTNGQVAGAISALRAKVGGGKEVNISTQAYDMSQNYVPPTSIVPADTNALAFARTAAEVLPIVYLGGSDKVHTAVKTAYRTLRNTPHLMHSLIVVQR